MKYGIREHLAPAAADRLQRLHVALLQRAYARQLGAPSRADALDVILNLAAAWDPVAVAPSHTEQLP